MPTPLTPKLHSSAALPESPTSLSVEFNLPPGPNTGSRTLTRSTTDIEAITTWLERYTDSPHTFDAYKRESERWLAWCEWKGLALTQVMAEDMVAYQAFLQDPQPRERWCLQTEPRTIDGQPNPAWKSVRRPPRWLATGEPNPAWRPFVGALSPSAAHQAITILFGLFEYLCGIGYLAGNPLRASRTRTRKPRQKTIQRYLERSTWDYLLAHLDTWPRDTEREQAHYQRNKFLLSFMYLTGLRRFEMAQATTSDLHSHKGQWWLQVLGKGQVELPVPLPTDAIYALQTYRQSTGRSKWPQPGIKEPLLMDIYGKGKALSSKAIHQILTTLFESAAQSCQNAEQQSALKAASAHWLRHTAATHQLEAGVPLLVVRDNLRHASVQTTERYLHIERIVQHEQTQKHRV